MRLTYKDDKIAGGYEAVYCDEFACVGKLGPLEDIEERYGIEILTLFKALVDGCYYLYNGKIEHFVPSENDFACPNLDNGSLDLMYASPYGGSCRVEVTLFFSRFGKTWALTKEDLL